MSNVVSAIRNFFKNEEVQKIEPCQSFFGEECIFVLLTNGESFLFSNCNNKKLACFKDSKCLIIPLEEGEEQAPSFFEVSIDAFFVGVPSSMLQ